MKKFYKFLFWVLLVPAVLSAQPLLSTDFSGSFPPTGWTIDQNAGNWSAYNSNNAGGTAPEARLNWSPQFTNGTHLISPAIDLTGLTGVYVKFNFMLDSYSPPYTIGVATRSGGGNWNVVWSVVNPNESIPATQELIYINNSDVGASDFQISWFFSGDSYNVNYWYIDNVSLIAPLQHDAMVKSILTDNEYDPGATFTPQAVVKNLGSNSETFDATCTIKIGGSIVYNQNCPSVTLAPDGEATVSFPDYTASAANELFEITFTTNLVGDLDTSNDSMSKWFDTYTTSRDMVIVEIGTGTWCQYCPGAALGADDLIDNGCSVAIIENHNGDPYANNYSNGRNTYYGISGFPTAVFDGQQQFVGGDHTQSMYQYYLPIYQSRVPVNSAYTIGIFGDHSGNDYNLTVRIHKMASTPPYNNIVLQFALTESDIMVAWQGQDHLNFVERTMSPDQNGTPLNFGSGDIQDINLNFTMGADWVGDNCELVAFIQNNDNKEILQGTKLSLSDLGPSPVNLILPENNATLNADTVQCIWSQSTPSVTYYWFELSTDSLFNENYFVDSTLVDTNIVLNQLVNNTTYWWRVRSQNNSGWGEFSSARKFNIIITGVKENNNLPQTFSLSQNYPNPFNPVTTIKYTVPQNGLVTIKLYDVIGREVKTLVNEVKSTGSYVLKVNAQNLSSGVYFYKMTAKDFVSVKKMSILK